MDIEALTRAASRLGETAIDPTLWPDLLQEIAEGVGAFGAMLLQSGTPTADVPWSYSMERMRESYYGDLWNTRDLRAVRSVAAIRRGLTILTDEDLVTREEFERDPYYKSFLASYGLASFAAVVFRLSPSEICGLVIQRTPSQGEFVEREKQALALLAPRLNATASLTRMLAESSLHTSLDVLDRLSRPALALGRGGVVIGVNAAAAALFDDDFRMRAGVLVVRDERAAGEIQRACAQVQTAFGAKIAAPEPIVVRRKGRLPLILRPLALDGPAGSFVLGARLLVTVTAPESTVLPSPGLLCSVFRMTGSESRLAIHLAAGLNLQQAAEISGITPQTARSQLKAVFSKTETNRQAELVALLGRL